MTNLTKPTGNIISNIMANSQSPVPVVGMGCTELWFSDRKACTIVEVVSPKRIVVQRDIATRIDSNGMCDQQEYSYQPNPEATKIIVTRRKNGRWVRMGDCSECGRAYALNVRREFYDYSR